MRAYIDDGEIEYKGFRVGSWIDHILSLQSKAKEGLKRGGLSWKGGIDKISKTALED